jgi:hypothetical protein
MLTERAAEDLAELLTDSDMAYGATAVAQGYASTVRGEITYNDELGTHVCTLHGSESVLADPLTPPTESGSWYYRCGVCRAGAWSGI